MNNIIYIFTYKYLIRSGLKIFKKGVNLYPNASKSERNCTFFIFNLNSNNYP